MSDIEIDYGEDPNEEYGVAEEPEMKFADSYSAFERTSGFDDEGWKDMGLFQRAEDFPHLHLSPEENFRAEVQKILLFENLDLGKDDKRIIVGRISQMNWIRFKVPILYVIGYYVAKRNFSKSSIVYAIQALKNHTGGEFELIMYARYWQSVLLY